MTDYECVLELQRIMEERRADPAVRQTMIRVLLDFRGHPANHQTKRALGLRLATELEAFGETTSLTVGMRIGEPWVSCLVFFVKQDSTGVSLPAWFDPVPAWWVYYDDEKFRGRWEGLGTGAGATPEDALRDFGAHELTDGRWFVVMRRQNGRPRPDLKYYIDVVAGVPVFTEATVTEATDTAKETAL